MTRYDKTLSRRIARAIELFNGDLKELFARADDLGLPPEAIEAQLIADLENDGKLFGKLRSNLMGATEQAVITAHQQGITTGEAVESGTYDIDNMTDAEIERLFSGEDPEAMQALEDSVSDRAIYTWVATLVNTCPYCVALHGSAKTKDEWRKLGLDPETVHDAKGVNAPCYCRLVLSEIADKDPLMTVEPLRREIVGAKNGSKGNRKTQRSVTQRDPEKALAAVDKAVTTKGGRATLKVLGNAAPPEVASAVRDARAQAKEDKGK
jgi:hypothetical protein